MSYTGSAPATSWSLLATSPWLQFSIDLIQVDCKLARVFTFRKLALGAIYYGIWTGHWRLHTNMRILKSWKLILSSWYWYWNPRTATVLALLTCYMKHRFAGLVSSSLRSIRLNTCVGGPMGDVGNTCQRQANWRGRGGRRRVCLARAGSLSLFRHIARCSVCTHCELILHWTYNFMQITCIVHWSLISWLVSTLDIFFFVYHLYFRLLSYV